ncbi:MAG: amino acid permease [Bacteroidetes bacterium]|nr:amino acid permease [Bacteroidota bacterium]MBT3747542.1 amino acid permease [Bacteroidota bacterium]MBT4401926.1 amino acid permease [Bacteroidota bacterium]MBT4410123.1 amino acid permease [Bacteroidota bacterium]MBT7466419.1 amino acid permease [Bacteroidota bacterium]
MSEKTVSQPIKFGTFLGVFTPSVLTILGVMMYLRFGWVLGNLGLPLTLLTVILASSITFVTGLSASAISTNMKVGVGGEYYMISRSLGIQLGGAIGIPLFLCRTLSLTLYAFGLAESIAPFWPAEWGAPPIQLMAALIILFATAVAGKSANLSLKMQLPIMGAVGLSLIALFTGVLTGGFQAPEMVANYHRSAPEGFWFVFAVFFPAVTGFTAGIGMSGDLKDSKKSIPKGTILAVITGTVVYILILTALSLTSRVDGEMMAKIDTSAPPIWSKIAFLGMVLIYPGLWGAILSSAFGSILGGPRVLQALSLDKIAPKFLGKTSSTGQPTTATWVTGGIALMAVALGDLNAVGRWVTIFFLTLYIAINLSAVIERLVGDVSYRPTIQVHWIISLFGCIGAGVVMFLINPVACVIAITLELLIYSYLKRKALQGSWGDVRAGLWSSVARFALIKLKEKQTHARNWRPNIILFSSNPKSLMQLTRIANWFNQNRGIVTVCRTIIGEIGDTNVDIQTMQQEIEKELADQKITAFPEVNIVSTFEEGVISIIQANGFAGMQSNTVMFGWTEGIDRIQRLLRIVRVVSEMKRNSILAFVPESEKSSTHNRIDVWWRGMQKNGDMMLLLAHLLNMNTEWRQAKLHLRTIVSSQEEVKPMAERLKALIAESRMPAECDVLLNDNNENVIDLMHEWSKDADIVFLGLALPDSRDNMEFAEKLDKLVTGFKSTILVRNAESTQGALIE